MRRLGAGSWPGYRPSFSGDEQLGRGREVRRREPERPAPLVAQDDGAIGPGLEHLRLYQAYVDITVILDCAAFGGECRD